MKKLLSLALVAVFAMSFVAGIMVSNANADLIPLCWKASECDYSLQRVRVCCEYYKPNGEPYVQCYWDYGDLYAQWCS